MKISTIQNNAVHAINEAFSVAIAENHANFIAYLAQGDYIKQLDKDNLLDLDPKPSPYCTDYMKDIYGDESREKFYVRYLNRRYIKNGFAYLGEEGIDDLNIEMMIYTHVWESEWFLKNLYRLGRIVSGNKYYDWDLSGQDFHGYAKLDEIKNMFKCKCPKLYDMLNESYRGYIRDSFAHMLFTIDEHSRIINLNSRHLKNDRQKSQLSFNDFQLVFLNSVELCYVLRHKFHEARMNLATLEELSFIQIELPDGRQMHISNYGSNEYPRFEGSINTPQLISKAEL